MTGKTFWKPPLWLVALDAAGALLLGLGLWMRMDPDSGLARGLSEPARLGVLVVGGALFAICWGLLAVSVLAHARSRVGPPGL